MRCWGEENKKVILYLDIVKGEYNDYTIKYYRKILGIRSKI